MSIPIKAKEKEKKKKKDSRLSLWLLRSLWGVHPAGLLCSKFTFANICHAFFGGDVHYFCSLSKGFNSAPACTQANTPSQTQTHVTKPGEETYWAGSASVGSRVWHDSWVDSEEQRCSSLSYKIHRIFNLNHFAKSTRAIREEQHVQRRMCNFWAAVTPWSERRAQVLEARMQENTQLIDDLNWQFVANYDRKELLPRDLAWQGREHSLSWFAQVVSGQLFTTPVRLFTPSHQTNSFAGDPLKTAVDNSSNDF